ncbi:hypothetical protein D5071_13060 [Pectobacterium carotovorum]|uniref:Uncharacterized protein n=1 Tax=Pectobacterium carotovorum TaxID=554 RepID=A0A419AUP5_PECCA|nr:hypothetical protein D5071_13060 [Pectobacterium carotovorum]
MRDILSLTEGQPLAGQIRSRRICPSLAAFLHPELFRVYLALLLKNLSLLLRHDYFSRCKIKKLRVWWGFSLNSSNI